ncbi:MAG: type VII secretion protein EssC [Clostridiales Family XIII bacterium]|jgi:S-DNA-T family DNA segregation ATPase FtsK/SpoIIIE|nr:type VII secretion protein EssC [Clostridiales Family XIII bacterium]
MVVNLIRKDHLYFITLPSKIKGQFWLCDRDEAGRLRELIRIEAENGSWILKSNKTAWIIDANKQRLEQAAISALSFYSLEIAGLSERISVFAEPVSEDRQCLNKVLVTKPCELTVGREGHHNISYDSKFISESDGRGHAKFRYDGSGWFVTDQNSTNGTYVNGERVASRQLSFGDLIYIMGLRIVVGKSFFAINNPEGKVRIVSGDLLKYEPQKIQPVADSDEIPAADFFYRSPRFKRAFERAEINIDPPPQLAKIEQVPLALMLGPSLTMGLVSLSTGILAVSNILANDGDVKQALPTLLMAVSMLIGTILWPILTKRHEKKMKTANEKLRQERYHAYLDSVRDDIRRKCKEQSDILAENIVTVDECISRITEKKRDLWERILGQDDFLHLRLGRGTMPLNAEIKYPEKKFTLDDDNLRDALFSLGSEPKLLKDVPISVSLVDDYISGIVGPRSTVLGLVRSLLIQMIALHSYDELKIMFIVDAHEIAEWEFAKWFPHAWDNEKSVRFLATGTDEVKELSGILEKNILSVRPDDANTDLPYAPYYLIIAADRALALKCDALGKLLSYKKNCGFSVITLYDDLKNIPKETVSVIDMNDSEARIFDKDDLSGKAQTFAPDSATLAITNRMAEAVANIPLDISAQRFSLPATLTYLEMFGVSKIEHLNPLIRWKENNPSISLQTPIGVDTFGEPFVLDLHENFHGPHGLVAGTTGSGKSEFLQTYILSLATNYHPNEVSFLLIDFKGGGLTTKFEITENEKVYRLPHLAGTVTNLDGATIKRVIVAIESESNRRQEVLNAASPGEGAVDIYGYQRLFREKVVTEPMPHLFIICDEFSELKTQAPDFLDKLISIARVGRSRGIHLILATQKPAGVVDDQIWSNSKFRICLKVQEKADSMDMLKRPDAAEITQTGRFFLQVGFNELFAMGQSAWSGAEYIPTETVERKVDSAIRVVDYMGRVIREAKPVRKADSAGKHPKQLVALVKHLCELATEENISVTRLWKDPIPALIYIDALEQKYSIPQIPFELNPIVGEYDDPYNQRQLPLTLPITDDGNAILYGAAGGGKTTLLTTLIYSLIKKHSAEEINIYALDFGAETLKAFESAPQVGDVLLAHEEEKIINLFKMLLREFNNRRSIFSQYGGDLLSYNKNSGKTAPNILVLINNYAAFSEQFEAYEDTFALLSRDGLKYGIQFVVTASNTMAVRYRIQQNFKQILTMQLNDDTGYAVILGKTGGIIPSQFKGRGLVSLDRVYEFQTAYPTADEDLHGYLRSTCEKLRADAVSFAKPVPVMPDRVTADTLTTFASETGAVPVGILKDSLDVALFDVSSKALVPVLSNDLISLQQFAEAFCEVLSGTDAEVVCLDAETIFANTKDTSYEYLASAFEDKISALFQDFVKRHDAYKRAKRTGGSLPTFTEKCVILVGVKKLFETLPKDRSDELKEMLKRADSSFGVCFFLVDLVANIKALWDHEWYKVQMNGIAGIWVGDGFAGQSVLESYKKPFENIGDDYGYIVQKGKTELVKLVSPMNKKQKEDPFGE